MINDAALIGKAIGSLILIITVAYIVIHFNNR